LAGLADEAQVLCVGDERILNQPPRAEEPRPHCAHRDVEDRGGLLVRAPLQVHENQDGVVRLGEIVDGALDRGAYVELIEQVPEAVVHRSNVGHHRWHCVEIAVVAVDHDSAPVVQAREAIAADREQPPPGIASRVECAPPVQSAKVRLLHEVVGICSVAR
jgi:hypothetical protein